MRHHATALATFLLVCVSPLLTACSGSDEATSSQTLADPATIATAEAVEDTTATSADLSALTASCTGAADASGPLTFTDASLRAEDELLVVTATLTDGATETDYPSAVFSATLIGPDGGMIIAGLKPSSGGEQAIYTFDMATSENTYYNGSYMFADGQVTYRVPLSAFDRLGGVAGWAFSVENDGLESDYCGSAFRPIAVD